ncbi:MAG: peptide chain release factor-like protein [Planctomycetota bacterium]|nr:peptide chain release factor-like protein [Planctomycetota bacterium]
MHPVSFEINRLLRDCDIRRQRRSGPGGQRRNKVETGIVITHLPTGIRAEASERRSQEENRRMAIFRLRINLALQFRTARCGDPQPSELWQSRRRSRRVQVSAGHDDFPVLLAEALDVLVDEDMDIRRATTQLGVSGSQLTKLLKLEPRAIHVVNARRTELGLRPIR